MQYRLFRSLALATSVLLLARCGGGGGGASSIVPTASITPAAGSVPVEPGGTPIPSTTGIITLPTTGTSPQPTSTPTAVATVAPMNSRLNLNYSGFSGSTVAAFPTSARPRQLAPLPNGDLIVGIASGGADSSSVYLVPGAENAGAAEAPVKFATLGDATCDSQSLADNTQGVAFAPNLTGGTIFVGRECAVYAIDYTTGMRSAPASAIHQLFTIRQGPITNFSTDGDVHHTTSLAVAGNYLYTSVGSSCNACAEGDATRAAVHRTDLQGNGFTTVATRIRNAIAVTVNPSTGAVWAGGAGQDCLETTAGGATPPPSCQAQDNAYASGHPYEFIDPITAHAPLADYMWPACEENKSVYIPGANCSAMAVGRVRMPAYSTIIGATIYPGYTSAAAPVYAFPSSYRNGLFVTMHGSWHETSAGTPVAQPAVAFVPLSGDTPIYQTAWGSDGSTNPMGNWARNGGTPTAFLSGFQSGQNRYGQPAGVAVGVKGSLFISDDKTSAIYRIRPGGP